MIENNEFLRRFDVLRSQLFLSKREISKVLGISESTYADIKKGKKDINNFAIFLWKALNTHYPEWIPYLSGETDNPPAQTTAGSGRRKAGRRAGPVAATEDEAMAPGEFIRRIDVLLKHHFLNRREFLLGLGCSESTLVDIRTGKISAGNRSIVLWKALNAHYPEWIPYLSGETDAAPPAKEKTTASVPPPASLAQVAARQALPYDPRDIFRKVQAVLDSGDEGIINALVKNIDEFSRAVQMAQELKVCWTRIEQMAGEMADMRRELNQLQNEVKNLTSDPGRAGDAASAEKTGT